MIQVLNQAWAGLGITGATSTTGVITGLSRAGHQVDKGANWACNTQRACIAPATQHSAGHTPWHCIASITQLHSLALHSLELHSIHHCFMR